MEQLAVDRLLSTARCSSVRRCVTGSAKSQISDLQTCHCQTREVTVMRPDGTIWT